MSKATETTKNYKVGWARYSPHYRLSDQYAALTAAGCQKIYTLGKDGVQSFEHFSRSIRVGDVIGVFGLHRFAETKKYLASALKQIAEKRATVFDCEMNLPMDSVHAGACMANAYAVYAGEARMPTPEDAKERGSKGGRSNARLRKTPLGKKHLAMWRDVTTYPKNKQAAEAISRDLGYFVSVQNVRRRFGSSGRLAGWIQGVAPLPEIPPMYKAPKAVRGNVYFVRLDGKGPVKIGYAVDVKRRIGGLSVGNHKKPVLVGSMIGTQKTEKKLHAKFAKLRIKGEWFKYTGDLKIFIESLPDADS